MIIEKFMRTLTHHFDHVNVAIQILDNVHTMKIKDLVGTLEAHELRIIERKCVKEFTQALQAQIWKKHGGFKKFKGKSDKGKNKNGSW
jgi:hypothetical protein